MHKKISTFVCLVSVLLCNVAFAELPSSVSLSSGLIHDVEKNYAEYISKDVVSNSPFIDPACIAPQFGYEEIPVKAECGANSESLIRDAINGESGSSSGLASDAAGVGSVAGGVAGNFIGGGVVSGMIGAGFVLGALGCGSDPGSYGSNSNTLTDQEFLNNRIKIPTFLELKIKIYHNIISFLIQNAKTTTVGCKNIISDQNCIITSYGMPSSPSLPASANVTSKNLYDYIIYSTLYEYITRTVLNNNLLEKMRESFAKGYNPDSINPPFETKVTAYFEQTPLVGENLLNKNNNTIEYKGVTRNLNGAVDEIATDLAKMIVADPIFYQKLGYNALGRFPVAARLAECLDGTFANLFLRDLPDKFMTPHAIVQSYFKPMVMLVIILYIIVKGYSLFLAIHVKTRTEVVIFFLQTSLVVYFSIGNAWVDFAYGFLKSIPTAIGGIILESMPSSADGCTVFKPHMYPFGKENIAIFDVVDCKLLNYLGLPQDSFLPGIMWGIVIPLLIPIPILDVTISGLAVYYMFSVIATVLIGIQMYITAMISFVMLLFLAPIIIPLCLFAFTKSIFDKWLEKVIATLIQQSISILAIVLCFTILDTFIYGANPEKNLFDQAVQVQGEAPKTNPIKKNCYNNGWYYGKTAKDEKDQKGVSLGSLSVTPMACLLNIYASSKVEWLGFPIHNVLWFFSVPFNYRLDMMLAFIFPSIVTILSMTLATTIIKPLQELVQTVAGIGSASMFKEPDGKDALSKWWKDEKFEKARDRAASYAGDKGSQLLEKVKSLWKK